MIQILKILFIIQILFKMYWSVLFINVTSPCTLISVQYLEGHLKFLAFFLQEASLYLMWNRAKEIWECLVSGMDVCELDREVNARLCLFILHHGGLINVTVGITLFFPLCRCVLNGSLKDNMISKVMFSNNSSKRKSLNLSLMRLLWTVQSQ